MRRLWTRFELDMLREHFGKLHPAELGRRIGRSCGAVRQQAGVMGLTFDRRAEFGPEFDAYFDEHYRLGWSDADIARGWGASLCTVGKYRRRRGLPHHRFGGRHVAKLRRAAQAQCEGAGVESLGALRALVWQLQAFRRGWPEGLSRTQGLILEHLESGPKTRRMLCALLGRPFRGCKSLLDAHGHSQMENLRKRGLVRRLPGRQQKGKGKGTSEVLYAAAVARRNQAAA